MIFEIRRSDNIIIGIHNYLPEDSENLLVEATVEDPLGLIGLDSSYIALPLEDRPTAEETDPLPCSVRVYLRMKELYQEIQFLQAQLASPTYISQFEEELAALNRLWGQEGYEYPPYEAGIPTCAPPIIGG